MPNKTLLVLASCVVALLTSLAVSGCGDDDDPGSSVQQANDGVLDGRDPCSLVDQAVVAQISHTETVTAESTGRPGNAVEQCSYNVGKPGIRLIFTVLPPADGLSLTDLNPDREGFAARAITVPGADEASVGRSEGRRHPEVSGCAIIGGGDRKLACVYIVDDSTEASADRLEPMVIDLLGRLVETL